MTRKRRGQEFWSGLVAEFHDLEISQVDFARRKRVKVATLRYWLAKLRETGLPEPVRFVELVAQDSEADRGEPVRLCLPGGVELHLQVIPSPGYLAQLDVELARLS